MTTQNQLPCDDATQLVPAYLDGELSEAQAGPLRKHLLDCVACRGAAQDLKNLQRWFAPEAAGSSLADVAVPSGFAARVARRAFAGDTGEGHQLAEVAEPELPVREILPYVRELTALAAAVLIMLAIGMQLGNRPSGEALRADEVQSLNEITQQLDELNDADEVRAEQAADELGADGLDD